jgi:hypothetical protein
MDSYRRLIVGLWINKIERLSWRVDWKHIETLEWVVRDAPNLNAKQ